jgi:spore maturation protein CgeB
MRLYEATGCGALLLTDAKDNLGDLFEVGKEVVAYRSGAEAAELVRHYLANSKERIAIARAGQQRTLATHSYRQRMAELVEILGRHLLRKGKSRA